MYYNGKKLALSLFWTILGATLFLLSCLEKLDSSVWGGMGGALCAVGILQLIRQYRYRTNHTYQEKIDTAYSDERNHYLRMKAWAWAGYSFVILSSCLAVVLFFLDQTILMQAAFFAECSLVILFYLFYLYLQKKG